jgi:hypothetical protein
MQVAEKLMNFPPLPLQEDHFFFSASYTAHRLGETGCDKQPDAPTKREKDTIGYYIFR